MELQAREQDQVADVKTYGPRAATTKFTYNSGSRPLSGYTLKRGIGRGGFGEVYFATSDAGKEVALKLIRRNLEVELRGVTQCLNLKHPNLIDLYDIRTDESEDEWVIMEYVSGESLDDVIDKHPHGLPVDQAMWWIRGICAGVAYLHDHGIVHRDLKPGNIFSDQGTVKVGDYGLAKFISCSRRSGQTESVGTVHYMAPEISNGRYGKEIDTYALGIILYELLTGKVPFDGESVGEVLMKHLTAEPELDQLDEPYRNIVQRALAKDPQVRLKSVGEMLALLPPADLELVDSPEPALNPPPDDRRAGAHSVNGSGGTPAPSATEYADWHDEEEPIYRAIREGWEHCERGWQNANLHPMVRAITLFAMVAGLITTAAVWLPTLFMAFFCYAIYYAVRGLVLQTGRSTRRRPAVDREPRRAAQPAPDPRPDHAPTEDYARANHPRPVHPQRRRRMRLSWRTRAQQQLAAKPLREKLSELLGSMLMSALIALLVSLFIPVVAGPSGQSEAMAMQIWFMAIGTLGSWAVIIPTKFAEGKIEDQVPMRAILLVMGAVIGLAGWGLADTMSLELPYWDEYGVAPHDAFVHGEVLDWDRQYGEAKQPLLGDFIGYFALLFVMLRWWRQAEFTRSHRLSIWSVTLCLFWACCLHVIWWFPQPAGMMLAGVIAVSTQLSSPWLSPSRRRLLCEGGEAA